MEDRLRKHMKEKPGSADIYRTDYDEMWSGIEDRLDTFVPQKRGRIWLRIAASVIMLVTSGILVFNYMNKISSGEREQVSEFIETEGYYSSLIQQKYELIRNTDQEIDPVILQDLDGLDKALLELKDDLKDDADNQEVVEAMVRNYRVKLMILEKILDELEKDNNAV